MKSSILSLGLAIILLPSCVKFVDVPPPQNELLSEDLFRDEKNLQSAIDGVYSQVMNSNNSFANGGTTLYLALSADEIMYTSTAVEISQFYHNQLLPSNTIVDIQFWSKAYRLIYQTNTILEGVRNNSSLPADFKNVIIGEALFLRAFFYHYLTSLFGDVPLVINTDFYETSVLPRSKQSEVYKQIVEDLQNAVTLLPVNYMTANRTRPNRWAAEALLARVFLYQRNWLAAEQYATAVINSGTYNLSPVAEVFLADSKETIWQMMPVLSTANSSEGFSFIPSSATVRPTYAITAQLVAEFEGNDQRKAGWLKNTTVAGSTYYYPAKYKVRSNTTKTEFNVVLRLAEMYLIRAEARLELGKEPGAMADLNKVRSRAGLSGLNFTDKEAALSSLRKEKQLEYMVEWGHRWFDLIRWGKATEVLGSKKPNWNTHDIVWPVPQSQITRNRFLTQNEGYQ